MRTAKKSMRVSDLAWEMDDDRTVERRVRVVQSAASLFTTRLTRRMEKVDSALIAIARGELEPDGTPARGPAPTRPPPLPASGSKLKAAVAANVEEIEEIDCELVEIDDEPIDVDDGWLTSDVEPEPFSGK